MRARSRGRRGSVVAAEPSEYVSKGESGTRVPGGGGALPRGTLVVLLVRTAADAMMITADARGRSYSSPGLGVTAAEGIALSVLYIYLDSMSMMTINNYHACIWD